MSVGGMSRALSDVSDIYAGTRQIPKASKGWLILPVIGTIATTTVVATTVLARTGQMEYDVTKLAAYTWGINLGLSVVGASVRCVYIRCKSRFNPSIEVFKRSFTEFLDRDGIVVNTLASLIPPLYLLQCCRNRPFPVPNLREEPQQDVRLERHNSAHDLDNGIVDYQALPAPIVVRQLPPPKSPIYEADSMSF